MNEKGETETLKTDDAKTNEGQTVTTKVKTAETKYCGYGTYLNKLKPVIKKRGRPKQMERVTGQAATVPVYSCYLGRVPLPCTQLDPNTISLMSTQHSPIGPNILVKQVSGRLNNLDPNQQYSLDQLKNLPTVVVNIAQCETNWHIIQTLKPMTNKTQDQINQLNQAMNYNNAVDSQFLMCKYLEFLHTQVGINSVTPDNCLMGIVDVPNFDNAYWSGSYMLFGDGRSLLYPTCCVSIISHELFHGVEQTLCGLGYDAENAQINEGYADIGSDYFTYWLSLQATPTGETPVESTWLIGEEACRTQLALRDMSNPNAYQQPFNYKGWFWAPLGSELSYAAHCNMGVMNFLFYKATEAMGGRNQSFPLFLNCLKQLPTTASYRDIRDIMTRLNIPQSCLDATSLTADQNFDF